MGNDRKKPKKSAQKGAFFENYIIFSVLRGIHTLLKDNKHI
jgi:hypothetical protein